jgi:hypothetical protein
MSDDAASEVVGTRPNPLNHGAARVGIAIEGRGVIVGIEVFAGPRAIAAHTAGLEREPAAAAACAYVGKAEPSKVIPGAKRKGCCPQCASAGIRRRPHCLKNATLRRRLIVAPLAMVTPLADVFCTARPLTSKLAPAPTENV